MIFEKGVQRSFQILEVIGGRHKVEVGGEGGGDQLLGNATVGGMISPLGPLQRTLQDATTQYVVDLPLNGLGRDPGGNKVQYISQGASVCLPCRVHWEQSNIFSSCLLCLKFQT